MPVISRFYGIAILMFFRIIIRRIFTRNMKDSSRFIASKSVVCWPESCRRALPGW